MTYNSYSDVMSDTDAYISIKLDLKDPVEIHDFAKFFAGMGSQFDTFLKENHPDLDGTAKMYVKEVRRGSVIADLVPAFSDVIGIMDNVLIVGAFASLFSQRVRKLISGQFIKNATKSDLQRINDTISAIANDKDGSAQLETIVYREGILHKEIAATFTTKEARTAQNTIVDQIIELNATEHADKERVLMVFERPGKSESNTGKRSGETVIIEEISRKPKPLIYQSELVEKKIKTHFVEDDAVIFKEGFIVDVNIERRNGKIIAYWLVELHSIIDLPDDDDES